MEIQKIDINNFAVYKNFIWNDIVKDKTGNPILLTDINIIYGRNYSGKTTLSRIFRAFETGILSDKYENPNFSLSVKGEKNPLTQKDISKTYDIRVFNEDFIKDNLSFISDPEKEIKSFAILGEKNKILTNEISLLEKEINSSGGLLEQQEKIRESLLIIQKDFKNKNNYLEQLLHDEALDPKKGIKYKVQKFGEQNYTILKLKEEIKKVDASFVLSDQEKDTLIELLKEDKKEYINEKHGTLNLGNITKKVNEVLQIKLETANKIQELVENALLNNWVKEGIELQENRDICAFCGNPISPERWGELHSHFNDESKKISKSCSELLDEIDEEFLNIDKIIEIHEDQFYSTKKSEITKIHKSLIIEKNTYTKTLHTLKELVNNKQKNLFKIFKCLKINDNSNAIISLIKKYNTLVKDNNNYSESLEQEKKKAKNKLRFDEIYSFVQNIDYKSKVKELNQLTEELNSKQKEIDLIQEKIDINKEKIEQKTKELNDEKKGSQKVNDYLNNFFGNQFLKLIPIEKENIEDGSKTVFFEIQRNGTKAYNMSEGECSLVAFCYFIAKLDDINTKGTNPIIWIDDPISSLDSNHIFFIYSLLAEKILETKNYDQLFISTHNLDFLKYLKRIKCNFYTRESRTIPTNKAFFIISRKGETSEIKPMPQYMKDYVTEFNYLFNEIYKCANINSPTDENYPSIYNFGNNARKFLEIYLFYKFPDNSDEREKQYKFFNSKKIPVFLNERIDNEYSHLSGDIERASYPIELPEIKKSAQLILDRLKNIDSDQYAALLNSIGVNDLIDSAGVAGGV